MPPFTQNICELLSFPPRPPHVSCWSSRNQLLQLAADQDLVQDVVGLQTIEFVLGFRGSSNKKQVARSPRTSESEGSLLWNPELPTEHI